MSEREPLTAAEIDRLESLRNGAAKLPWTSDNDEAIESFECMRILDLATTHGRPEDIAFVVALANVSDRLIATARRSIPDETPLDEEWMKDQGGWRMHEAMQSYIRDFGDVRLTIDVPLGGSQSPWAAWVERTSSGVRSLVRLNDVATRAQLAALVSALGGAPC